MSISIENDMIATKEAEIVLQNCFSDWTSKVKTNFSSTIFSFETFCHTYDWNRRVCVFSKSLCQINDSHIVRSYVCVCVLSSKCNFMRTSLIKICHRIQIQIIAPMKCIPQTSISCKLFMIISMINFILCEIKHIHVHSIGMKENFTIESTIYRK